LRPAPTRRKLARRSERSDENFGSAIKEKNVMSHWTVVEEEGLCRPWFSAGVDGAPGGGFALGDGDDDDFDDDDYGDDDDDDYDDLDDDDYDDEEDEEDDDDDDFDEEY
jgi:hypothetical protein